MAPDTGQTLSPVLRARRSLKRTWGLTKVPEEGNAAATRESRWRCRRTYDRRKGTLLETHSGLMRALPYMAMGMVVAGNVLGNIFLKLGSGDNADRALMFGLFGWQTIAGIGFFASAVLLYAWALKHLPLHMAQGVASLQFIGAILAAWLIFQEAISLQKWVGIGLICMGLMFVTT